MSNGDRNWRELCCAALDAKDSNELLRIVQELKKVLKREEQLCRNFREASRAGRETRSPGLPHEEERMYSSGIPDQEREIP